MPSMVRIRPFTALPSQTQSGNHGAIAPHILPVQVLEQSPALAYQFQETPLAMIIVLMTSQVLCDRPDPIRQQGYLHLGRPRVIVVKPVGTDYFLL